MSFYTREAPAQAKFMLYLSNKNVEKNSPSEISTASQFQCPLDINLNPLIFLKSSAAQVALSNLSISELPCCITTKDFIEVSCHIDTKILHPNLVENTEKTKKQNDEKLIIKLQNVTAPKPESLIEFLNSKLSSLNYLLLQRFTMVFYDKRIFKSEPFKELAYFQNISLKMEELHLLQKYSDICLYARLILHQTLLELLPDIDTPAPKMSYSNSRPPLNKILEDEILQNSDILLSPDARAANERRSILKFVNFADFYDIDFTRPGAEKTAKVKALNAKQRANQSSYLQLLLQIDPENITEKAKIGIRDVLQSNLKLISIGNKISQLLSLEISKLSPNFPEQLFNSQVFALTLDPFNLKTIFRLSGTAFFSDHDTSFMSVKLTDNISYSLGLEKRETIIGPLSGNPATGSVDQLPNKITKTGPNVDAVSVRNCPKVIRIATNMLVFDETRDEWMAETDFHDFHLLYSQAIENSHLESRFITKMDENRFYYRMLRSFNNLTNIKFLILDQNSQLINFPKGTLTNISLCITPYKMEDTY